MLATRLFNSEPMGGNPMTGSGRRCFQRFRACLPRSIAAWLYKHDNPFFGWWFTLWHREYRIGALTFEFPRTLVPIRFRSRFLFDLYEHPERRLIAKHLQASDRVLELGGCLGIVACCTNQMLADARHHVVVEANPELIPWLDRNRRRNQCGFAIEFGAVSEQPELEFYLHQLIVGGSANRKTPKPTRVVGRSLGELTAKHGIFTALIMDIEGGEHQFLRENAAALQNLRLIILEMHDFIIGAAAAAECRTILGSAGFVCSERDETTEVWHQSPPPPEMTTA